MFISCATVEPSANTGKFIARAAAKLRVVLQYYRYSAICISFRINNKNIHL